MASRNVYRSIISCISTSILTVLLSNWLLPLPVSALQLTPEDFHCGSGAEMREAAFYEIMKNCPGYALDLNHCCAIHDDCYGQRRSQEFCDAEYAKCNLKAVRVPDRGASWCRSKIEWVNTAMPLLGYIAYSKSNYSDPSINDNSLKKHLPEMTPNIEMHYEHLYSACPFVNITLSSCAWMFNDCLSSTLIVSTCTRQLSQCVLDAAEQQNSTHCTRTSESMCAHIMTASELMDSGYMAVLRKGMHSTWAIILLVIIALTTTGLLLLKLRRFLSLSSSNESKIKKYAPIQVECLKGCNSDLSTAQLY
ncbi:hypothetical protein WR25_23323 [Diploscapter pachys]|uniref:Uncharacterized protein n=1 Tax=Diploscapter pachys TaxID=2018661 RepID=A0A2A2LKN3_9BILA|nr:hypothetical protein WR25_23323 [Diploscapter pachys]